jgi:thiol reductant ABC exporter CydC subunit
VARLLALIAPFWSWVGLSVFLGFLATASGIALLATSAWIIATAALQPSIAVLQVAIVGVRFFGIARGGFRYLERLASHEVTFRLLARLRIWFYAALEPVAPARLMHYRSGDLLARVVADIDSLEHFYVRVLAPPAVALLIALAMGLFMAAFDRRLALALLAFLATCGVLLPAIMRALGRAPGRALVATRARMQASVVDGVQGMADLIAFGAARLHLAGIQRLSTEMAALQRRMAFLSGLQAALSSLGMNLAVLTVLILAVPLVAGGRMQGVDLAVLALAAAASFEAVLPLPLAAQYLESSLAAARRLLDILDAPAPAGRIAPLPASGALSAAPDRRSSVAGLPSPIPSITRSPLPLRFSNLYFRYAPGERPALNGISFFVPRSGHVAVVGPSGAGKTTLVNLLLRFWDYDEGEIWLGGRELRSYAGDEARALVGVVAQRTHLFNASVRDNLLLARPSAGQAELEWVARQAQIHDFIQSLPQGYDTWLGEQGLQLSGGERQRLAIARALLKDAPVLVLDEATANLDPLTDAAVRAALRGLMADRTVLTITHRLTGLEDLDRIVVLQAGRVAECGSYRQLMQAGGLFRRMWASQQQFLAGEKLEEAVDLA